VRSRRRRLGQHFLCDARVATAIAAALPDAPARVFEVGPGRGALTSCLLRRFPRVRAVEVDADLAARLPARLGRPAGLEVISADALDADIDALAGGGPWLLAGNLPYSVGTAIIRRLLPRRDLFPALVVMIQEEVARRLLAPPGDGRRGLLSVEVEAYAEGRLLFTVPPRCFVPAPKVTSAVVTLLPRPSGLAAGLLGRALKLAGAAFTHRRKKLANALAGTAPPDALGRAIDALGIRVGARPQDLALSQWAALAASLPGSSEVTE
jgi:16S rRNA (adenine1518-N6/adenine1519-N6)-dimethyltransferase